MSAVQLRPCGPCHACCTALLIDHRRLQKAAGVRCQHLAEHGCGIYKRRPRPCREFLCLWAQGALLDEDRPDLVGAVAAYWGMVGRVTMHSPEHGAWQRPAAKLLAKRIAAQGFQVLVLDGDIAVAVYAAA